MRKAIIIFGSLGDPTHEYTTSSSDLAAGATKVTVRVWAVARRVNGKLQGTNWITQNGEGEYTIQEDRPLYWELTRCIPAKFSDPEEKHRKTALAVKEIVPRFSDSGKIKSVSAILEGRYGGFTADGDSEMLVFKSM